MVLGAGSEPRQVWLLHYLHLAASAGEYFPGGELSALQHGVGAMAGCFRHNRAGSALFQLLPYGARSFSFVAGIVEVRLDQNVVSSLADGSHVASGLWNEF